MSKPRARHICHPGKLHRSRGAAAPELSEVFPRQKGEGDGTPGGATSPFVTRSFGPRGASRRAVRRFLRRRAALPATNPPRLRRSGAAPFGQPRLQASEKHFGADLIRYDYIQPRAVAPIFPVLVFDGSVESSLRRSQILARMPEIGVDNVYCDKSVRTEAIAWRDENKNSILGLG